jgi:hypothetical protein
MSWRAAGGLVWHIGSIDPTGLGERMRAAGFGWVAVFLADGLERGPDVRSWVERFRRASGLPVGGWSVLRGDPVGEARLAADLVAVGGLDFYVADAEREYGLTNDGVRDPARYARSAAFTAAFRLAEPDLPAGLASYCRPDQNDLDWQAWADAGFAFLPQAYVNQHGPQLAPAACAAAAAPFFPRSAVHPTVGVYGGPYAPVDYAGLLADAGTTGFSLYPAEATEIDWPAYAHAIATLRIARAPG